MIEGLCETLPAPLVSLDQLLDLHSGNSLTWGRQSLLKAHGCQRGCETKVLDRMSWHFCMINIIQFQDQKVEQGSISMICSS